VLQACKQDTIQKLPLNFYVETLCPDCVHTIGKIAEAIPKGLLDLADLNLVIAGNAKVTGLSGDMHQFTCQHGPEECYGNAVEACIWSHATSKLGALMSIKCMFAKTDTDGSLIDSALVDCAAKYTSFDVKDVQTCATSSEGNK